MNVFRATFKELLKGLEFRVLGVWLYDLKG